MSLILSIDVGTTGVTALVVDGDAQLRSRGYQEFPQYFPEPGLVEHDPDEIMDALYVSVATAVNIVNEPITAIGITNQRETLVIWDRETGCPIYRALVWQDRRTAPTCERLHTAGHDATVRSRTGLVLDSYFSATKASWILDHVPGARERAENGELAFGTIDTWVCNQLTGGATHVTEPSNACRTMLYDIGMMRWSTTLCDLLGVPKAMLPPVVPSTSTFGVTTGDKLGFEAPITGILGDQQAALLGQGCVKPGMSKNTYGTGSFVLMNTGNVRPFSPRLLSSVAWDFGDGPQYVLEGSIFVTGAGVQWLRDGLGIIDDAGQMEELARSVDTVDGVYFVPALTGLGAPYWDPHARGLIIGLTRGTERGHVARAALEAMAFQTRDVIEAMVADAEVAFAELRVDGGAAKNNLLCQIQADVLNTPVIRPKITETTALGAAFAAGLGAGMWNDVDEIADTWRFDRRFTPGETPSGITGGEREDRYRRWQDAVRRARNWAVTETVSP